MKFIELAEQVLAQRERDGVRGIDRELSRYRCHIQPAAFAQKDVTEITTPEIREWLREMQQKDAEGPGESRKLSRQTISRCQSLVSAVFTEAVEKEIRPDNPSLQAKQKKRVDESDTKEKWAFLTGEEQKAIEACEAIPREARLAILFAIHTGLRQGEQHCLELADVHLDDEHPHIVVRYGSVSKAGKKLPPKSGKMRKVYLLADGVRVTREWLAMLPTFAPENPEGLVFPTAQGRRRQQGKPLGRSGTLRQYLKLVGVTRRVRWHDLRHTCATSLITGIWGRRWTLEEVQKVCGHSSITITQRYAHLGEDALKRAVRETAEAAPVVVEQPAPMVVAPQSRPRRGLFVSRLVERIKVRARQALAEVSHAAE